MIERKEHVKGERNERMRERKKEGERDREQ